MENERYKNWNNFFLGLAVVVIPWLGLPAWLKSISLVVIGLLIALFSLARVRPAKPNHESPPSQN